MRNEKKKPNKTEETLRITSPTLQVISHSKGSWIRIQFHALLINFISTEENLISNINADIEKCLENLNMTRVSLHESHLILFYLEKFYLVALRILLFKKTNIFAGDQSTGLNSRHNLLLVCSNQVSQSREGGRREPSRNKWHTCSVWQAIAVLCNAAGLLKLLNYSLKENVFLLSDSKKYLRRLNSSRCVTVDINVVVCFFFAIARCRE